MSDVLWHPRHGLATTGDTGGRPAGLCRRGAPIYAECGGLAYLSRSLSDFDNVSHKMSGVLPLDVTMDSKYLAISYVEARARIPSPLGEARTVACGPRSDHELTEELAARATGAVVSWPATSTCTSALPQASPTACWRPRSQPRQETRLAKSPSGARRRTAIHTVHTSDMPLLIIGLALPAGASVPCAISRQEAL